MIKLRQRQVLQGESFVSVEAGEVPVVDAGVTLYLIGHSYDVRFSSGDIAMTINFLRSGCPAVQLTCSDNEVGEMTQEQSDRARCLLNKKLIPFALGGESFEVVGDHSVFIVTRTKREKTKKV